LGGWDVDNRTSELLGPIQGIETLADGSDRGYGIYTSGASTSYKLRHISSVKARSYGKIVEIQPEEDPGGDPPPDPNAPPIPSARPTVLPNPPRTPTTINNFAAPGVTFVPGTGFRHISTPVHSTPDSTPTTIPGAGPQIIPGIGTPPIYVPGQGEPLARPQTGPGGLPLDGPHGGSPPPSQIDLQGLATPPPYIPPGLLLPPPLPPPNPRECQDPCLADIQQTLGDLLSSHICEEPCIQDILSGLEHLKDLLTQPPEPQCPELEEIELPYTECLTAPDGSHEAKTWMYRLIVLKGSVPLGDRQKFQDSATLAVRGCTNEPVGGFPIGWELRPEYHRPQLALFFREQLINGKLAAGRWPIHIPHYSGEVRPKLSPIPAFTRGSYEGILTLADNSKVTIHANSEALVLSLLDQVQAWINPVMLSGSYIKAGKLRKGEPLKEAYLIPWVCKFYSQGAKKQNPDWVGYFAQP